MATPLSTTAHGDSASGLGARIGKFRWAICALLFFATTINYIDRQVLGILAPDLQKGQKTAEGVVDLAATAGDGLGATVPLPVVERTTEHGVEKVVVVDPKYVQQMVASIVKNQDLSRYIL